MRTESGFTFGVNEEDVVDDLLDLAFRILDGRVKVTRRTIALVNDGSDYELQHLFITFSERTLD